MPDHTSRRTSQRLATAALVLPLAASPAFAQDQAIVLDTIDVQAQSNQGLVQDGYVPISGRIGAKSETPIVDIPQSISIVTQKQLEDLNPQAVDQAVSYVPGVTTGAFGFQPRFDAFYLRGFSVTYNGLYRDGLRQFASPNGQFRSETYGLEAIEVLKGPSGTLYGASSPGGIVNLVTKKPTEQPFREVMVEGGTYDRIQGNMDLSGPLNDEGTVLYRLTGVLRDSGTEMDAVPDDRVYIAPAITFKPTDDTTLTVLGEYMNASTGGSTFYYFDGTEVLDIPEPDPSYNEFSQDQWRVGYEFEHRFNETFSVFSNSRYAAVDVNEEYSGIATLTPRTHYAGLAQDNMNTFVTDNFLKAEFDTGIASHTFLVGAAYNWVDYDNYLGYGTLPRDGAPPVATWNESQTQQQFGIYANDEIEIDNFIINLGTRYDWLHADTDTAAAAPVEQNDEEWTYRAALSYRTPWGLVPYVSYGTTFTPNVGTLITGAPAKPTSATQVEGGVKYAIPGYNALVTASVYQIDMTDGVVFDASTGINEQVQQDMLNTGFEIEAVASLTQGLSLTASYGYNNIEIQEGARDTEGNKLNGVPFHQAAIFADYTFQKGFAAGLGGGLGVRYLGESYGDDYNIIKNDARTFVDAALHYDFDYRTPKLEGVRLQVNATNLFDERGTICADGYCYKDPGRTIIGSLRYRF
ncbi:TonB-dependent siderophore receptor [Amorphus orientalis]|uniref:Iron complex outermembrane receptor protein n=1 Tax=Amorphus orientalis TaxID=649198 RepID=A0AAE4ASU4_9HYPH|nr:TonB-dependent siderophore receptor [Amorphus orientalis]MDQ0315360.1 iron complex outermembrane receptor protein [Amorphus orientalis]